MGDYGSLSEYKQLNFIETNTFDVITDLACIQTWFIASDDGELVAVHDSQDAAVASLWSDLDEICILHQSC